MLNYHPPILKLFYISSSEWTRREIEKGTVPAREIHNTLSKDIPLRNCVRLRRTDDWKLSPEELTVKAEHGW